MERRGTLLAADMGTGKTCISSTAIFHWLSLHPEWDRILIICPASVKANWVIEYEEWRSGFALPIETTIGIADGKSFPDADVVVINYDLLHREQHEQSLFGEPWHIIVIDECTKIKNKSLRTNAVKRLKAFRKIALTGTPIENGKPVELWNVLNWLAPDKWSNWKWYTERFCDAKPGFGRSIDVSGSSNEAELHKRLKETVMFRITKEEALPFLPQIVRQIVPLPPPEKCKPLIDDQKRIWRLHEETIDQLRVQREAARLNNNEAEYKDAASKLKSQFSAAMSAMSRIRAELGEAKIPVACHFIQDAFDDGAQKIVVFAHHHKVMSGIADHFQPFGSLLITGDTPTIERQGIVEAFKKPEHRIIVCSLMAASMGINGLQVASHLVMVESDWTPAVNSQAESRLHRNGQLFSVLVQHLVFDGSLDAKMVRRCIEKQEVSNQVIDGKASDPHPLKGGATEPKRDYKLLGANMSDTERRTAHEAIKHLARLDADGARRANGAGFSKVDTVAGHQLAAIPSPSTAQYAVMRSIAMKYKSQLPPSLRIDMQH